MSASSLWMESECRPLSKSSEWLKNVPEPILQSSRSLISVLRTTQKKINSSGERAYPSFTFERFNCRLAKYCTCHYDAYHVSRSSRFYTIRIDKPGRFTSSISGGFDCRLFRRIHHFWEIVTITWPKRCEHKVGLANAHLAQVNVKVTFYSFSNVTTTLVDRGSRRCAEPNQVPTRLSNVSTEQKIHSIWQIKAVPLDPSFSFTSVEIYAIITRVIKSDATEHDGINMNMINSCSPAITTLHYILLLETGFLPYIGKESSWLFFYIVSAFSLCYLYSGRCEKPRWHY